MNADSSPAGGRWIPAIICSAVGTILVAVVGPIFLFGLDALRDSIIDRFVVPSVFNEFNETGTPGKTAHREQHKMLENNSDDDDQKLALADLTQRVEDLETARQKDPEPAVVGMRVKLYMGPEEGRLLLLNEDTPGVRGVIHHGCTYIVRHAWGVTHESLKVQLTLTDDDSIGKGRVSRDIFEAIFEAAALGTGEAVIIIPAMTC